jgi:fused signal recognition particle receptor
VTFVILGIVLAVLVLGGVVGYLFAPPTRRRRAGVTPPATTTRVPAEQAPTEVADTASQVGGPPVTTAPPTPAAPAELDAPPPSAGRLVRLRNRLSGSQSTLGRGLLALLSRETIDESVWDEVEEVLLTADVGLAATQDIVSGLRERVRVLGTRSPEAVRGMLREALLAALGEDLDRQLQSGPRDGRPAVVLVVGVNGSGKTTTCGKLARVLVGDGRKVLLGAADTFRAAAADQLATWGERVGAAVVRGPEGADPASVAFDAVHDGTEQQVDTVVIDTAGRLHTKTGLMDELGKVKRVVERERPVDEVLLVLDATTGQNGLIQARVFSEVVTVTGIALTKLDGTAKGGIIIAVQRELGVPVKLVGLGEGPDDLAPFEPEIFVDALLGSAEYGTAAAS